ncbi:MAG: substrate-binding domain-containing protein [Opitutaceae bacterium]
MARSGNTSSLGDPSARRETPADCPRTPRRVGLREIAAAAGVSTMAVSLSLRNSPEIAAATRGRIQELAHRLGYRPDPELTRLMEHLRNSRSREVRSSLAIVDFYTPAAGLKESNYCQRIRAGAAQVAGESGYSLTSLHARDYQGRINRLLGVIRSRGIEGVIILPNNDAFSLEPSLDWSNLSVVAATSSLVAPRFHRVLPDQFGNMMMLLQDLSARGLKRIGGVLQDSYDARTAHTFVAAMRWAGHNRRLLVTGDTDREEIAFARQLNEWMKKVKPDVIIAQFPARLRRVLRRSLGLRVPEDVVVVGVSTPEEPDIDYVDERPELVGATAVRIVSGMIYHGETGVPASPHRTLIEGQFVVRPTSRIRRARSAKPPG